MATTAVFVHALLVSWLQSVSPPAIASPRQVEASTIAENWFHCSEAAVPIVAAKWVQVAPNSPCGMFWIRRPEQQRVVVLIHGLSLHPVHTAQITQAELMDWQQPDSKLVKLLRPHADVYSFCYGQNMPVTAIADQPILRQGLELLRQLGYAEVVLVGFSAGGLVARQFVEDYPLTGVTRVVQVCTPNLGTKWARSSIVAHTAQDVFLKSMTPEARATLMRQRADKRLPEKLEFVCVVGTQGFRSDGLVPVESQWPADLREQGIPAAFVRATHLNTMYAAHSVELISRLAITPSPRLPAASECQSPPMP